MKWLPQQGSSQHSEDGRYCIVQDSQQWIAYALTPYGTGDEVAIRPTDAEARTACDIHATQLIQPRKTA